MKAHVNFKKIGLSMIAVSIVLTIVYLLYLPQIVRFMEYYLSSDHQITPNGIRELVSTLFFGMVLVLVLGVGFLKAQDVSWRAHMRQVFLGEPLCRCKPIRPSPGHILIVSSLVGLFLIASMRLAYRFPSLYTILYYKDYGVIDLLVPASMFISAVLLSTAVWKLWKEPKIASSHTYLSIVYLIMIVAFVFIAGEEISWGQDFFKWRTPQMFSGNVEDQTNLHNYFNDYFNFGYVALSLVLVVILVSIWLEFDQRWLVINRLYLPHPSMIGLSLLIAFVAIVWYREQELLEEMVAVFALLYSIRIFTCFRSKDLAIET